MSFIESIKDYAIQDYRTSNVLPSITISQAILESGWGKSYLATEGKNLFGIKVGDWRGEIIALPTKEYIKGNWITVYANFRKYRNYGESIKDHSELLNKSWYLPVIQAKDYKGQAKALQSCGYATDPNYANLLIQIIEENKLYQYDNVSRETSNIKMYAENGKATVLVDQLSIRNTPSTKGNNPVRYYYKGETFYYDSVYINEGYYWVSYISYSGVRRYVASRKVDNSEIYLKCV